MFTGYSFVTPSVIADDDLLSVTEFTSEVSRMIADGSFARDAMTVWFDDAAGAQTEPLEDALLDAAVLRMLSGGYEDVHSIVAEDSDWSVHVVGGIAVWYFGDDSMTSRMRGVRDFLLATRYLPSLLTLMPWLLNTDGPVTGYADSYRLEAVGIITSKSYSLLHHSVFTHPDPDLRAEIIDDLSMPFTADELAALAGDAAEQVRTAASRRLIVAVSD